MHIQLSLIRHVIGTYTGGVRMLLLILELHYNNQHYWY